MNRPMQVVRYANPIEFAERALPFLADNEAANGLFLGITNHLCADVAAYSAVHPYLATVESDSEQDRVCVAVAIMTPPFSLLVQCHADDATLPLSLLADDLSTSSWAVPRVNGPSRLSKAFVDIWAAGNALAYHTEMELRTFLLTAVIHPTYSPGRLRPATTAELELVVDWAQAFTLEAIGEIEPFDRSRARTRFAESIGQGTIFFWDKDGPVSIASCGRPSAHGIAINMVYTPPQLRGQGYAGSCVAALSQRLLDDGWQFCTLFTDLANPTSNSIYQRIGYRAIGDFTHYRFEYDDGG